MGPSAFENICRDAGAGNLHGCIYNAISSDRMSTERKQLSKLRTMVIIYIMVYSQSRSKWLCQEPSSNLVSLNRGISVS